MSPAPLLSTLARALVFTRGASTALTLSGALETLCIDAAAALDARRTSVWLYDRRGRELAINASSDPEYVAGAQPVAADGPSLEARGMRLDAPRIVREDGAIDLAAPLRGWRRALGTLVVRGLNPQTLDEPSLLELAAELARHLSAAIENVQLLEEVVRQRRLLEDTFNSLADLVVVTDRAQRIVQVNDAVVERTGGDRAELFDRPLAALLGREMAEWAEEQQAHGDDGEGPAATRLGRTRTFEEPRLGGTFAATVTPLVNEDGHTVGRVLVARDITRQVQLEAEQSALRERLAQSEKLAALGQFVAGIAHEMNNPLQGVLGHVELLLETTDEGRPFRHALKLVYNEADRAAKIVRNLLVFTGAQRMTRRRLRVDRVIARALASRSAALDGAGIVVTHEPNRALPAISADPLLLQQALLNVLINAEHAIEEAGRPGRIDITTGTSAGGAAVTVTVRDNGPGIPGDVITRIFDPFFTTKDVGKGTGLGLAITYGIIQEHGGTIQAANAPDGGAIMTIELPALPQSPIKYAAHG
jgi:two-component system NtrC family sensor kinase